MITTTLRGDGRSGLLTGDQGCLLEILWITSSATAQNMNPTKKEFLRLKTTSKREGLKLKTLTKSELGKI